MSKIVSKNVSMYVSLLDSNLNTGCHMRYMFSYTLIKNLKGNALQ